MCVLKGTFERKGEREKQYKKIENRKREREREKKTQKIKKGTTEQRTTNT